MGILFLHSDSDHQSVNMYTCECCGKSFKKLSNLQRHFRRKTICVKPEDRCYKCGKGLKNYRSLCKHLKSCPTKFEIKCYKQQSNHHSLSRPDNSYNANLISTNTPVKDANYSNPTTLIDTPNNTLNIKKSRETTHPHSLYPSILSHIPNNHIRMDPSTPSRSRDTRSVAIPPRFNDKTPIPIAPCPALSPTNRLKKGFVNRFINKKLIFDEDPME